MVLELALGALDWRNILFVPDFVELIFQKIQLFIVPLWHCIYHRPYTQQKGMGTFYEC